MGEVINDKFSYISFGFGVSLKGVGKTCKAEKAERHEWVLIHMGFGVYIYGSILYILTITKQTRIHQRERERERRERRP